MTNPLSPPTEPASAGESDPNLSLGMTHPEPAQTSQAQTFDADYVEKLRGEAASHRTKLREAEKTLTAAQKELEALRAAQAKTKQEEFEAQGNWKALAEQNALRLAELEPRLKTVEQYEAVISELLTTQREGLPEPIVTLLDKMPPVEQIEWLNKYKASLMPAGKATAPPNPAAPNLAQFNPAGQPGSAETDSQRISRLRKNAGQMVSPFDKK